MARQNTSVMQGLRKLQINMRLLVSQIRESAQHVNTQLHHLAQGNDQLADRTSHQASSVEQTSVSVQQLTQIVAENVDSSQAANAVVFSTAQAAERGAYSASQVKMTMTAIQESARKIVDIIGLIDGIAFQTNILALNAAVEAARAGEQGKGFAVVASEVRNLALRSAASAQEVKQLILAAVERIDQGSLQVQATETLMEDILASAQKAADIMQHIAMSGHEQHQGIDGIWQAITQIRDVTQKNVSQVAQVSATSAQVHSNMDRLLGLVDTFKLVFENRDARTMVKAAVRTLTT